MFFVALVVFGILDPIISNRDLPEDKAKANKLPNAGNNAG
jgi:hypothetical protein